MSKIKIDKIQAVLFSPGIVLVDKLKVASTINDILSSLLDGDPVILPIPEDAPSEFPRVRMGSKDGKYTLSIAKNRVDFIFKYETQDEKSPFPASGFFDNFLNIFQYFKENIHTQFIRSAIVTNWIVELEGTLPAEFLFSKYIRSETPIIKPYELELNYLTKESIAGFKVNKWVRIKSVRKVLGQAQNSFISFLIDINTLSEMDYEFNNESLEKFLLESSSVIKETVNKHFKEKEI